MLHVLMPYFQDLRLIGLIIQQLQNWLFWILLKCQKNVKVKKIVQLSIAHLLADAIIRIHERRPLSPLFELHLPSEQI